MQLPPVPLGTARVAVWHTLTYFLCGRRSGQTGLSTSLYSGGDLQLVSPLVPHADGERDETFASSPSALAAWQRVTEELQQLGTLSDDWDGQGAGAPPRETV